MGKPEGAKEKYCEECGNYKKPPIHKCYRCIMSEIHYKPFWIPKEIKEITEEDMKTLQKCCNCYNNFMFDIEYLVKGYEYNLDRVESDKEITEKVREIAKRYGIEL